MPTSLPNPDRFVDRHLGPSSPEIEHMLDTLGMSSLDELSSRVIPDAIQLDHELALPEPRSEAALLDTLRESARRNRVLRSFIGTGYYATITPPVIQRNILEDPGWYTQYTPYQAEIAQGRLEALLNYQTMICDLTALPVANASLLDEATAAAEAMLMCRASGRGKRASFFVSDGCHPQTRAVVATRAEPVGIRLLEGPATEAPLSDPDLCGILLQYPSTDGTIENFRPLIERARENGVLVVMATDLLSLTLLTPPGELGANIAVGSSQRFGVPMAGGGPHAAFLAAEETLERQLPGRIVGMSKDSHGRPALRLALQTREQHIRREKATSNICTAQVLLAIMAAMYAVYHGPRGLTAIAQRVHRAAATLAEGLRRLGAKVHNEAFFDTLRVSPADGDAERVLAAALERGINLRSFEDGSLGIALDERVTLDELDLLFAAFAPPGVEVPSAEELVGATESGLPAELRRQSAFLTHEVFERYHSEHKMLRYLHKLKQRDISLTHSMIPLGSCTMKLNATAEMVPITWTEFADMHPFAPVDQAAGYEALYADLERWLSEITGLGATSLQPNAGSQGEYTGLLTIRAYHADRGDTDRDVCLIPTSAHGTNPASAIMAGFRVVAVAADAKGNIDLDDLAAKVEAHADHLGALMITYPSTHGIFEARVREVCDTVHAHGGLVYLDGANMNAQVGLCRPGDYGADVCHLNLHKTFCIPHGGGGPGMGPICVNAKLEPFLPGHPNRARGERAIGPVAAAPYGSPGILPISWMYVAMMGADGLRRASQVAILNANYMARRLAPHYPVLYTGAGGLVAHEFIIDARGFKDSSGIQVEDIAKRLIDYGFHAPTMSWPVAGTMMIEPTESESQGELDRFCDAMIAIREEIRAVESGAADREDNVLKNAPHTSFEVTSDSWAHPYGREQACYPLPWLRESKFWPAVSRIDNAYGDRHLVCTCEPMESFLEPATTPAS
jgi:glycine dehydrogenase